MSNQTSLQFEIPRNWAGHNLSTFLRSGLSLSRTRIRVLKKNNGIFIDGFPVWVSYKLKGGEFLELIFPRPDQYIHPESLAISIIYEDDDIIVVDKPPGQVVHPVKEYQSGTLANALIEHWRQTGDPATFHPVHRLDRMTSGLVLIAKSSWVHQQMASQLEERHFHRLYLAVCKGAPPGTSGRINLPVARYVGNDSNSFSANFDCYEITQITPNGMYEKPAPVSTGVRWTVDSNGKPAPVSAGVKWTVDPNGKPAITRYRILGKGTERSLLALKLFTGRTHQIRVHLSHLGFPLWGDPLYGHMEPDFTRPALHAIRLCFTHPRTRKKMKFRAEIPPDFHFLLAKLR
jgi:23S rRNA pseudouridine1911/1915/1917 synthase